MSAFITRLRGLSPFGPIFGKELRVTARRKSTYILRFVYLGALLLILCAIYAGSSRADMDHQSLAARQQRLAELGAYFFLGFAFFTLGTMALIAPITTCAAINSERQAKTLAVLLMTPITSWQIVTGKLFSRMLILFSLIGLTLPLLAVVRLLGGVEVEDMFGVVCICTSFAIMAAALGLLLSSLLSRAYAVILLSYVILGVMYGLVLVVSAFVAVVVLGQRQGGPPRWFFNFFSIYHPVFPIATLAFPDAWGGVRLSLPPWWANVLVNLGFGALFLIAASLILRRRERREHDSSPAVPLTMPPDFAAHVPVAMAATPEQLLSAGQAGSTPPPLPAGLRTGDPITIPATPSSTIGYATSAPQSRAVAENPVLWREVRRPLFPRKWQRWAAGVSFVAVMGFFYFVLAHENEISRRWPQGAYGTIFCGIMCVLGCVLSATAIAHEKETDTWTLMLATPMSASRIVWGKLLGLLRKMVWPMGLFTAHFLLFTLTGVIPFSVFVIVVWLIASGNTLFLATGLYLSLRLKTVTMAIILNLLCPIVLYIVPLVSLAIIDGVDGNRGAPSAELVGVYCPYAYIPLAIDDFARGNKSRIWMPFFHTVPQEMFLGCAMLCGAGHVVAAGLITLYTIKRFNIIVGRARQLQPLPSMDPLAV